MSDYLPQEVLVEILARLPVKSLLRCRCVSKSWTSLITSPNFITMHINQTLSSKSNHNTRTLLRHYSLTHHKEVFSYRLDLDSDDTFDQYEDLKCPLNSKKKFYFRINGSCNGLLFLTDDRFGYTNTMFLWNPSIRRYLTLPLPRVTTDLYENFMCVHGFGFDPKTDDYKVVRISYVKGDNGYIFPPELELYKLSTRSWIDLSWEAVRGVLPPFGIAEHFWSQIYMNGNVHWLAYKRIDPSSLACFVLLFDMGDEVFSEMELPGSLSGECPLNMTVALLGESLSVLQYDNAVHSKHCTVWMMKGYGVAESWAKLYTIDLERRLVKTIGLRKNGDLLLVVGKDLVSYHPEKKQMKKLGVHSTQDAFCVVGSYMESLLLIEEGSAVPVDTENSAGKEDEPRGLGIEHSEYAVNFFTHRYFFTF